MIRSTLCYLRNGGRTLFMLRDKKRNDVNEGKWIGVGGKFEKDETAGECVKREVMEETGITPEKLIFHGIIYFRNDEYEDEEMYLYSAHISDEVASSVNAEAAKDEGTLSFIRDEEISSLNLWEGDRVFLKDMLEGKTRISYDLNYRKGKLTECKKVPVTNILFDLDGTLIDTGEGIMKCAAYALESEGIKVPDYHELSFFVGPPLVYTYTVRYGFDMQKARELVDKYRERYNPIGVYECEPYPGVRECLKALKEKGYKLYVASSKPEHMCRLLLDHFDLSDYFDDVAGSTPDGKIDTKSQVLAELFRRHTQSDPCFAGSAILVGDTKFDIMGAIDTGISSLGVSFGYGSPEEMQDLGACGIADSLTEIDDRFFKSL